MTDRPVTRKRLLATCAAGALLTAGAAAVVTQASPALAATTANVWLTTPDRANQLTQKAGVAFGTAGSGSTITVNPNTTYQSMVGFGASFTDSSANLIYNSSARNSIMTSLFNPTSGIGLSFLRQPLGASDFSLNFYTYDDGSADPSLSRFSIAHDQAYILPLLTQARSLNPQLSTMVVPWSAPAWMKTNGNLIGGSLSGNSESTFADYLVRSVQAYQAAGVPVQYLSVQNEPQFSPPGYPGMLMSASQQAAIINNLAPKLSAAGLGTKILAWDHNWDNTAFPQQVLAATGNNTAGTGWHCYGGDPSGQSTVRNAYPNKDIFFTECSGIESGNTFADSLLWQGRNLAIGATRNWAKTVTLWNMALNASHGPVIGSCTNCMGVVTVNGGSVTYNAEYYVLGHLAKFVKPGAVRIDSTGYGQGGIENVAFRNPDGSIVLVAVNSGGAQNFQVSFGGSSFGYNLPAGAMATFTWPGGPVTPTTQPPTTPPPTSQPPATSIDPTKWYQVVNTNSGKCLDDAGWGTANGTALQQWTCGGASGTNQQWQFRPTSNGYYQVVNRYAPGLVWDVNGGAGATGDGAQVHLWGYGGGTNQQWLPASLGGGAFRFTARNSGKCLDVRDVSTADGAWLQQWGCTGGPAQSFRLVTQG